MVIKKGTTKQPDSGSSKIPRFTGRGSFIKSIFTEWKRITWPTKNEASRLTILVLSFSIILGLILYLFDLGATAIIDLLSSLT